MMRDGRRGPAGLARAVRTRRRALAQQPAPTVIHFARFEQPFLRALAGGVSPLDLVCTHDIARRLLPDLPRCSLRALTGYFGRAVGALASQRRSRRGHGVRLARAGAPARGGGRVDVERAARVARRARRHDEEPAPRLADAAGRTALAARCARASTGCCGRAATSSTSARRASLHHRVNSYFRKQNGIPERMLEMLSQARGISFEVTPSALEAALLEPDEIKRHRPPYNVALTVEDRALWFASPDLSARGPQAVDSAIRSDRFPPPRCSTNSWRSPGRTAPRSDAGRWGPEADTFRRRLRAADCARTPSCRAGTSVRTPGCCGWARACGGKVGEIVTGMRTRPPERAGHRRLDAGARAGLARVGRPARGARAAPRDLADPAVRCVGGVERTRGHRRPAASSSSNGEIVLPVRRRRRRDTAGSTRATAVLAAARRAAFTPCVLRSLAGAEQRAQAPGCSRRARGAPIGRRAGAGRRPARSVLSWV